MKPLRRAGALLLGLAVALAAAEGALRLSGRLYSRYRLPNEAMDPDAVRVLCVGDSFTFGIGAPKGQSYPEQLQRLLDARRPRGYYQVIDGGVPGSNSSQLLARLPGQLDDWRPQVLVVMTGWNDTNLADSNYWRVLGIRQLGLRVKARFYLEDALASSRVYKLVSAAWSVLRRRKREESLWYTLGGQSPAEISERLPKLAAQAKADPAGFRRWLELGIYYHKLKRFPEALAAYQKAVAQDPESAQAHYQLAWMYHLTRDFPRAKAQVEESLSLDPDNEDAKRLMGNYLSDSARVLTPEAWLEPLMRYDLERVLDLADARGMRVVLLTYPSPNAINDKLRDVYERLGRRRRFSVVDQGKVFSALSNARSYYSGDEPDFFASHLDAKGYALMAKGLLPALDPPPR